ncbi:MAG: potassium transporter Trk [Microbacterium sp. SCN 70-200]|uniref:potassium transporter Trk n=1 Tax=unclassified Microbacterium TaxID=2609290 RepID=UPI00086B7C06|nr:MULTISPECIES: potassium transporter Trk [unclassified Microbacterium]MBN9215231.1 potassium transporter Trk [Microbacterium sp.]ODT42642.1 MAG: potassium transporter Trk [Microbacterium sp. SCN 70-200]OJV80015.1 MAG: potassium transporter Trk [Microbacterium sp. 70-16]
MSESTQHHIESAQLRRSPRYAIFFVLGAALGILAALILTFAFDGTAEKSPSTQVLYSTSQVFGFLCLVCIPIGLALGGVVALILDRRFARRAREVRVDHERIEVDYPADAAAPAPAASPDEA